MKTTHESNIDLIGHSLVFTQAGILAEPVNIRNSPGIDIFDPDFAIEHRPFCSHVGSAIQNWSPIQCHMQQQSEAKQLWIEESFANTRVSPTDVHL